MMIECPRCHFRQPQDQYCAKCGIDMTSITAPKPSVIKTIFNNVFFQLAILIGIVSAVTLFALKQNKPQEWTQKLNRFQPMKIQGSNNDPLQNQTTPSAESARGSSFTESHQSEKANQADSSMNTNNIQVDVAPGVDLSDLAENTAENTSDHNNKNAADETQNSFTRFKIEYVGLQRESLGNWIQESQRMGTYQSFTDYAFGVINNPTTQKNEARLLLEIDKKLEKNQPDQYLNGKTIDENSLFIGLDTSIELRHIGPYSKTVQIKLARIERNIKEVHLIELLIPNKKIGFIHGFLKPAHFDNDKILLNKSPFQIFKSNDFLNDRTEFVMIVKPI